MTLRAYRDGIASMATLMPAIGKSADTLHAELRTLIANSRQRLAGAVNAELARLYWHALKLRLYQISMLRSCSGMWVNALCLQRTARFTIASGGWRVPRQYIHVQ